MSSITIKLIQCLKVSSALPGSVSAMIDFVVGLGAAVAGTVLTEGAGAFVAAGTFASGAAASKSALTLIAEYSMGEDDDNVYLKIGDEKVWGGEEGTDMGPGDKQEPNVSRNFTDQVDVSLWDWDRWSDDDLLGRMLVKSDTPSGQYILYNTKQGSTYYVDMVIKP